MPRYFFKTQVGEVLIDDPSGTELPDADRAWEAARDTILTTLRESPDSTRLLTAILVVTDEEGEIVLEFPFAEAIPPEASAGQALH